MGYAAAVGTLVVAGVCVAAAAPGGSDDAQACRVTVRTTPFNPKAHKLRFEADGTTLVAIDGDESFSGSDGNVPKVEVRSIVLELGGSRLAVPAEGTRGLYEPSSFGRDCQLGCSFICDPRIPTFELQGGDGAGAYSAVYVFHAAKGPGDKHVTRILMEHPEPDKPSVAYYRLVAGR